MIIRVRRGDRVQWRDEHGQLRTSEVVHGGSAGYYVLVRDPARGVVEVWLTQIERCLSVA